MPTTVTPSFTGSIAATLQGIDVKSYRYFGSSLLPLIGRSDRDITFVSSEDGTRSIDSGQTYFDDSIRFPIERKNTIEDDGLRITKAPNFELEESTLGITRNFKSSGAYHELTVLKPTEYLTENPFRGYPVVLDHPNAIDPFDMNGVLEPLTIRDVATRNSLFVGNSDDPEPHSVKGGISGPFVEGRGGRGYSISNFYEVINSSKLESYKEALGSDDEVLNYAKPIYTTDHKEPFKAFLDTTDAEERNDAKRLDREMRDILLSTAQTIGDSFFPSFTSRSAACGFIFENSSTGTDSIVFGGLLR